jgi:hypothetical protein
VVSVDARRPAGEERVVTDCLILGNGIPRIDERSAAERRALQVLETDADVVGVKPQIADYAAGRCRRHDDLGLAAAEEQALDTLGAGLIGQKDDRVRADVDVIDEDALGRLVQQL